MTVDPSLRPLERRILRLADEGLDDAEIGRRFRHSPQWVGKVRSLAALPRERGANLRGDVLRPLERRILRWRASGAGHDEIAPRFGRSPDFVRRVEAMAAYKLRGPDSEA